MENREINCEGKINRSDYYNKLAFFKETWFVIIWVILIIGYTISILPPKMKKPDFIGQISIAIYVVLISALVFSILTDYRKHVILKRLCSILLIIIILLLFYFYSGAKWDLVIKRFFSKKALEGIIPIYLSGLEISLKLTGASIGIAVFWGLILGVLRSFHNPVFEIFLSFYIDVFRSIPLIALMMLVFYGLPFLGINLGAFSGAVLSIVLMYSAYIAEIFRAGIEAVGKIQLEAAASLGFNQIQATRLIILPQAFRVIIPPLTNSLAGVLKDTSVAYVVTLPELLTKAQQAMQTRSSPTPLIAVSVVYFLILFPLTQLAGRLDARSQKWAKKALK